MVVDQFNVEGVSSFEAEDNPPVGAHSYRPKAFEVGFKRVQTVPGNVEGLRSSRVVENGDDAFDRLPEVRPYPATIPAFIQPLETAMLEASDHRKV